MEIKEILQLILPIFFGSGGLIMMIYTIKKNVDNHTVKVRDELSQDIEMLYNHILREGSPKIFEDQKYKLELNSYHNIKIYEPKIKNKNQKKFIKDFLSTILELFTVQQKLYPLSGTPSSLSKSERKIVCDYKSTLLQDFTEKYNLYKWNSL